MRIQLKGIAVLQVTFALIFATRLESQELPREIWDQKFRSKRPPSSRPGSSAAAIRYVRAELPNGQRAEDLEKKILPQAAAATIGVTIWKRRPVLGAGDQEARLLIYESREQKSSEYAFERLKPSAVLKVNDFVRLSIECSQEGYLYVINRERYQNGGLSDSYLIFPSRRPLSTDNRVSPGRLVDIPRQDDVTPVLRIDPRGEGYEGEELLVVLSSRPIQALSPGEKPIKLDPKLITQIEEGIGSSTQRWDLADGSGKSWTIAEKSAATAGARLLTQDDPMPQSIYTADLSANNLAAIRVRLDVAPGPVEQ